MIYGRPSKILERVNTVESSQGRRFKIECLTFEEALDRETKELMHNAELAAAEGLPPID